MATRVQPACTFPGPKIPGPPPSSGGTPGPAESAPDSGRIGDGGKGKYGPPGVPFAPGSPRGLHATSPDLRAAGSRHPESQAGRAPVARGLSGLPSWRIGPCELPPSAMSTFSVQPPTIHPFRPIVWACIPVHPNPKSCFGRDKTQQVRVHFSQEERPFSLRSVRPMICMYAAAVCGIQKEDKHPRLQSQKKAKVRQQPTAEERCY